jgi:hypothetical protein
VTKSGVMQNEVGDEEDDDDDVGLSGGLDADWCCLNLSKDMNAEAVEEGDNARPACCDNKLRNCCELRVAISSEVPDELGVFDESQLEVSEHGVDGGEVFFILRSTTP